MIQTIWKYRFFQQFSQVQTATNRKKY